MTKLGKAVLFILPVILAYGQNLPAEYSISYEDHRLIRGIQPRTGLYNESKIRRIDLTFKQTNWKTLLSQNYNSKTDIPADLTYDGKVYANVGVRYKGQTSYQRVSGDKKSFNITMDFMDSTQDLDGYETLNFNNSFEDNSFMREMFYENYTRKYTPSLKVAYIHLYINGEDYGLYPHVQGLDGKYIKEWFQNNNGIRWRCERTGGAGMPGQGGGGGFGAGTSSLNYLGDDTTLYKPHYTLKNTELANPWYYMMISTKALANFTNVDSLNKYINVDEALWFLAKEILFGDDDGYVNKGGMDYHAYYDVSTSRLIPLEYDANSVMEGQTASWGLFLKENDIKYPLCNKLFAIPELRQRYLAHVRTMANDLFNPANFNATIDKYFNLIDTVVQKDPKKLMTYTQFTTEKETLKNWMNTRRNFINNHTEIKQAGVKINKVAFYTKESINSLPDATMPVTIKAATDISTKAKACYLYYGTGYDGKFIKTIMYDDGTHNDEKASDGIFGAAIPGQPAGTYIRYYVEAIADNGFNTASYMPEGAVHDVFIYRVNLESSAISDVVINEVVSANKASAKDQDNEYDDWIELYNTSSKDIDISRWILTDNPDNLDKYRIPQGTILKANNYLIVWADEDGKQKGYHANFKLSADGEPLLLLDSTAKQIDMVLIPALADDEAYARIPNGTGAFTKTTKHSFNKNNNSTTPAPDNVIKKSLKLYPNPGKDFITLETNSANTSDVSIYNLHGQLMYSAKIINARIDVSNWSAGAYIVRTRDQSVKFVVIK